jgi:hypothetical protein
MRKTMPTRGEFWTRSAYEQAYQTWEENGAYLYDPFGQPKPPKEEPTKQVVYVKDSGGGCLGTLGAIFLTLIFLGLMGSRALGWW